jgi:DNA invertase Pin-like site-specific DNA recombinase
MRLLRLALPVVLAWHRFVVGPDRVDEYRRAATVSNPHANRLTVHILAAVAEHERGAISERTKAALAAAKRRGVKLGGPRLAAARKASIKARSEAADAFAANVRPIIKEIQASGVRRMRGIARALTARGVKTARGDVQVAAILRR